MAPKETIIYAINIDLAMEREKERIDAALKKKDEGSKLWIDEIPTGRRRNKREIYKQR